MIQEHLVPQNNAVYRVWFVRGRICMAVSIVRPPMEFMGACAAGSASCTAADKPAILTALDPPWNVREKVLRAAEIANADCGSVELLYESDTGRSFYFDLNMVSTLPNPEEVRDPENLWTRDDGGRFNLYGELADYILSRL